MAASTSIAQQILHVQSPFGTSGQAVLRRMLEKATQTFNQGVPVQVDVAGATGFIIECPTMNSAATAIIAGISTEPGNNLTTSGVSKNLTTSYKVPNQPSAQVIPIGAPVNDGRMGFAEASDQNKFIGVLGDSANNALAVLAQAQVGGLFGLFKDPGNSFWYVDHNVTTVAAGACVEILELVDAVATLNGRVIFRVAKASQQLGS